MLFIYLSYSQNKLYLKSDLINDLNIFCRMVAPQLKNFEGLLSTEVDDVSGVVQLPTFTFKCARCMSMYINEHVYAC
jgi:hypothetical protein